MKRSRPPFLLLGIVIALLSLGIALAAKFLFTVTISPAAVDFASRELIFERRLHFNRQFEGGYELYFNNQVVTTGLVSNRYAAPFTDKLAKLPARKREGIRDSGLVVVGAGARELCCFGKIGTFSQEFHWGPAAREKFLRELETVVNQGTVEQAEDYILLIASRFWPDYDEAKRALGPTKTAVAAEIPTAREFLADWQPDEMTLEEYWAMGDF